MNEDDFKYISDPLVKKKEKELELLEHKKEQYQREIESKQMELRNNREILEKLQYENMMLKDRYNSLKRVIKERGLIIDIINDKFSVKEWDNLIATKEGDFFIIYSKRGERLKELDKDTTNILEEIIREEGRYSLVVIRVDSKHIKILFRVNWFIVQREKFKSILGIKLTPPQAINLRGC